MTPDTPTDAQTLALIALAATLADERRAQRFLDLTGIGTEQLRQTADDPALLLALMGFLEAHEPDLVAVSAMVGVQPDALVAARRTLESSREQQ
jgi:hypothetical protein